MALGTVNPSIVTQGMIWCKGDIALAFYLLSGPWKWTWFYLARSDKLPFATSVSHNRHFLSRGKKREAFPFILIHRRRNEGNVVLEGLAMRPHSQDQEFDGFDLVSVSAKIRFYSRALRAIQSMRLDFDRAIVQPPNSH